MPVFEAGTVDAESLEARHLDWLNVVSASCISKVSNGLGSSNQDGHIPVCLAMRCRSYFNL